MKKRRLTRQEIVNRIYIINIFALIFVLGILPMILDLGDTHYCLKEYDLSSFKNESQEVMENIYFRNDESPLYLWVDCEEMEDKTEP